MDFERIKKRLDALLEAGKKAELRGALGMLNEVDIAEYLESLDNEKLLRVFRLLPKDISADVFTYMELDQRMSIMQALSDQEAMQLIDDMFVDDAVDFLEELPAGVVKRMLMNCDEQRRAVLNQFLRYPENSAGRIMTIEYVEFHTGITVGQAMAEIRRTAPDKETINTLYILGNRRELLGTVGLRKLLLANDDLLIASTTFCPSPSSIRKDGWWVSLPLTISWTLSKKRTPRTSKRWLQCCPPTMNTSRRTYLKWRRTACRGC